MMVVVERKPLLFGHQNVTGFYLEGARGGQWKDVGRGCCPSAVTEEFGRAHHTGKKRWTVRANDAGTVVGQ